MYSISLTRTTKQFAKVAQLAGGQLLLSSAGAQVQNGSQSKPIQRRDAQGQSSNVMESMLLYKPVTVQPLCSKSAFFNPRMGMGMGVKG